MTFNELKKIFENETRFILKYDKQFKRCSVPGGMVLYSDQKVVVNDDIRLEVVCHGQTGWDNEIDVIPTSKKAKAARIAVRRECVPNIPKALFNRSVITQYGWELVKRLDDFPELIDKLLEVECTPNVNCFGYISNESYYEWLSFNQLLDNDWLAGLSGPRQESLLTILYDDWRKMPSVEDAKNREIYYYKIGS